MLFTTLRYWVCIAIILAVQTAYANWHSYSFEVMGTTAKVELWHKDEKLAQQLMKNVELEMRRIDQLMSPYIESSELSLINKNAADHPLRISEETFSVIQRSIEFSRLTKGAFDITFASVGYKYDYREKVSPSVQEINETKHLINYRSINLDEKMHTIYFSTPGTRIDLGGIAKGYAVDLCIEKLKISGVEHAFVQAGGDSRVLGDKQGRLWNIGIRHPRQEHGVVTQIPLENAAISTSGDYERFYIENGERIHHILDPKSGKSVKGVVSVSIIADTSIVADALSTSVFVLGSAKGLELINSQENISAIIIEPTGKMIFSDDLKSL